MTCAEARELFSARADDELSPEEHVTVAEHLETCAECRREWQRFAGTVGLLRTVEPARAPAGFVDRVLTATHRRPWYARLARDLFVPWPVKIPVQAAAVVLIGGLAVMIFRESPELQQAARPRATSFEAGEPTQDFARRLDTQKSESAPAMPETATAPTVTPPNVALRTTPPSEPVPQSAPAPTVAPGPVAGVKEADRLGATEQAPAPSAPPAESRDARALADAGRSEAAPPRLAQQQAEEPLAARRQQSPVQGVIPETEVPRAARPAPSERAKSSELLRKNEPLGARSGASGVAPAAPPPSDTTVHAVKARPAAVELRLKVTDRAAATREITALASRLGGVVLPQRADTAALELTVPRETYPTLARELARLGTPAVVREPAELADLVRVTITLTE